MGTEQAPTPSDASYWQAIYESGTTGWDLGREAPAWSKLLSMHDIGRGRLVMLGCGRGHDAVWFAQQGFDVTAVDFAKSAVEATRENAARRGVQLTGLEADLFHLSSAEQGTFDVLVEHTCFCAIEPSRRREFARVAAELVKPGGHIVGLLFWQTPPGGPPFATSPDEVRALFGDAFDILRIEDNPVSVERRAGREGWVVLRRKDS